MRVGGHKAGGRDSEINVTWISRKQQLLEGLGDALSREATSVHRQHVRGAREKLLLVQGQSTASCCCVLIEGVGGEALGAQSCRDRRRSLTTAVQTPAGGLCTVPAASCLEGFSGSAPVRSIGGGLRDSLPGRLLSDSCTSNLEVWLQLCSE